MNRSELGKQLRPLLSARRARLLRTLNSELSRLGDDEESFEEEIFAQLSMSESRELNAIAAALERISKGTFGLCEECGAEIALPRLQALPYTTTCIECQRATESRPARNRRAEPDRDLPADEDPS